MQKKDPDAAVSGLPRNEAQARTYPRRPVSGRRHFLDFKGKNPGQRRLCMQKRRLPEKAIRSKALERALEAALPEDVVCALHRQMEESHGQ